jgi:hypothetical protein
MAPNNFSVYIKRILFFIFIFSVVFGIQTTSVFGLPADLEEALTNENNPRNLDATIALAEGIQRSPKCAQG